MKVFIYKAFIFVALVFLLLISVNYIGDSAHLFDNEYESKIVNIILAGHNVTNISNYDERIIQKQIIISNIEKPEIVILGSSRTMLINSSFFTGYTIMNNSVSGASMEDLVAIYQIYKTNNILPNEIILGIDPWMFNTKSGQVRWKSLVQEYIDFVGIHQIRSEEKENALWIKYKQLISISYFQSSIENIKKVISGNNMPLATNNKYNLLNTKLTDGSLVYGEKMREVNSENIIRRAKSNIDGKMYGLEGFDIISQNDYKLLEQLIEDMQTHQIKVSIFLSPYHPIVFQKIRSSYSIVEEVEEKIVALAKLNKIILFGSFNPEYLGVSSNDFYDGMHCKENSIKKILFDVEK